MNLWETGEAGGRPGLYNFPVALLRSIGEHTHDVVVSSVHLAPHERNAWLRLKQVEHIAANFKKEVPVGTMTVVVGDFNMRENETSDFEEEFLAEDVWKATGKDPAVEATWDSRFYDAEFPRTERFDRMFVANGKCTEFSLVGNEMEGDAFLSDHFGMVGLFEGSGK